MYQIVNMYGLTLVNLSNFLYKSYGQKYPLPVSNLRTTLGAYIEWTQPWVYILNNGLNLGCTY
jgi:hypothetical protein